MNTQHRSMLHCSVVVVHLWLGGLCQVDGGCRWNIRFYDRGLPHYCVVCRDSRVPYDAVVDDVVQLHLMWFLLLLLLLLQRWWWCYFTLDFTDWICCRCQPQGKWNLSSLGCCFTILRGAIAFVITSRSHTTVDAQYVHCHTSSRYIRCTVLHYLPLLGNCSKCKLVVWC